MLENMAKNWDASRKDFAATHPRRDRIKKCEDRRGDVEGVVCGPAKRFLARRNRSSGWRGIQESAWGLWPSRSRAGVAASSSRPGRALGGAAGRLARARAGRPSPATDQSAVLLDQESLDWCSQDQWLRALAAGSLRPAVDYLMRNGARTAAFDVLYTEPSAYGVADDEALGAAVARFGNFVGAVFLGRQTEQTATWPEHAKPSPIEIQGLEAWLAAHPEAAADLVAPRAAFPVPEVAGAAAWLGNVSAAAAAAAYRRAAAVPAYSTASPAYLGFAAWHAGSARARRHLDPALRTDGGRPPDPAGRTAVA
jgi:hypothetical protein